MPNTNRDTNRDGSPFGYWIIRQRSRRTYLVLFRESISSQPQFSICVEGFRAVTILNVGRPAATGLEPSA